MDKRSPQTDYEEGVSPYHSPQPLTVDEYPPEWHRGEIQARIRERANHTCEICGMPFNPTTNRACTDTDQDGTPIFGHVHHLDHRPANCADNNLIFLCQNCHIRLHGLGWKPGDELPFSWGNEPPPWVLRRNLPYRLNPLVLSLHESARYLTDKQARAQFILQIIDQQGWITGDFDPIAEMRAFLRSVLKAYESDLKERERLAIRPILETAQSWADERGLVAYSKAVELTDLSSQDFELAVQHGYIQPEACPVHDPAVPLYFDPEHLVLSAEALQDLWAQIRLTRQQAADTLGVSVPTFERMRRRAGFKPVGTSHTESGHHEPLYRKRDVEALR